MGREISQVSHLRGKDLHGWEAKEITLCIRRGRCHRCQAKSLCILLASFRCLARFRYSQTERGRVKFKVHLLRLQSVVRGFCAVFVNHVAAFDGIIYFKRRYT